MPRTSQGARPTRQDAPPVPHVTAAPTPREGIGAIPHEGGTTFRVWAPHATAVAVRLLDDPEGTTTDLPLAAETGGWWSADVAGTGDGAGYNYVLDTPQGQLIRIDPYARAVTDPEGNGRVYDEDGFGWPQEEYHSPDWDELVIYELHVGTFDRPQPDTVGTLDDVRSRLDHLRRLGVTAVELLPLAEFQGEQSRGYDPALPFAVEDSYGGPDALKRLVAEAHQAGLAVILDVVYNHFGPNQLDRALWRFDGWFRDEPGTNYGGIYFYQDERSESGWGPRPDYGRPEIRQFIRDNAATWLQTYRIDGLRLDATENMRSIDGSGSPSQAIPDGWRVLQEINDDADATQPWKIRIAEDMRNDETITTPTAEGGAGCPSQWDPDFVRVLRTAVTSPSDGERDMDAVAWAVSRCYNGRALARVVYTESHDADSNGGQRVPSDIDPAVPDSYWAKKRSTLAAAAVLTAPAIPMLFQGQEFLADGWWTDGVPLNWALSTTNAGIIDLYRDLIALRRNRTGVTAGLRGSNVHVHHVNNTDKLLAYHRWDAGGPGDDTVVVLNFANRSYERYTIGLPRGGLWQVRLNSDATAYDPGFGGHDSWDVQATATPRDSLDYAGDVGLGPYTAVILSQPG